MKIETVVGHNAPSLYEKIRSTVPLGGRVLDVGSGLANYHPYLMNRVRELWVVDAFEPYLKSAVEKHGEKVHPVLGEAQQVLPRFEPYSFDACLAIDFLEHVERPLSFQIMEEMKRVSPLVVVFLPRGNHPQDRDYLGNGADHWQTHRSRWEPEDVVALGCQTVEVWDKFHSWAYERYAHVPDFNPDALWGVWREE